jgi:large subunit ribosomal protein L9
MAKTEVILIQNVNGLGGESDHLKVAPGYARNFLFPRGLAIPLTGANKRRLDVLRKRRAERESHELSSMTELAENISKLTLVMKAKTGDDGKLFGSVTSVNIAEELKHQFDVTLDRRKIHLEHPIKSLGEYDVELRLHSQVVTNLKVRVESTTPLPKPPEAKPEQARDAAGAPKRGEKRERTERSPKAPKTEKNA